ncbi:hypothetical protein XENOCAPTIV_021345, partial [Xenoophorus captivus]
DHCPNILSEQLKKGPYMNCFIVGTNIESRLKVLLPDDVGAALMDGVVLCHLANHICPRSVASIHDKLCLPHHILEERGLVRVGVTVQALLDLPTPKSTHLSSV